jgi:hypothetical protein
MDHRLKQRLVGAIVLVALAVIFIPMVLQSPEPVQAPATTLPAAPGGNIHDRLAAPVPQATPLTEPARQIMPAPAEPSHRQALWRAASGIFRSPVGSDYLKFPVTRKRSSRRDLRNIQILWESCAVQ